MKGRKASKITSAFMIIGVVVVVLSVISIVIGLVGGGEFDIMSLVLNLLLVGFYVCGAVQIKNNANI